MRCLLALASLCAVNALHDDVTKYDAFVPKLISQRFVKSQDMYPSELSVEIVWQSKPYQLDLVLNQELFAPDWSLESYDDNGALVYATNDTSLFMCHYNGVVNGLPDSEVVMSLCDELGMRGTIRTSNFHIETQHAVPLSVLGKKRFHGEPHIIYDLALVTPAETRFDSIAAERQPGEASSMALVSDEKRVAYRCSAQIASDSFRMNAFATGAAESQNTQALMAQAANRYRNSRWRAGADTLTLAIAGQTQNPSGWSHHATMSTKLSNLARYKGSAFSARHNLIGLTHFSYGGTIGLAYVNTMCASSNSCGVNNVGYSASDNNRGILVAHEIGHNFSFDHDSASNGGNGFVMWPSLLTTASQFSTYSDSRFRTNVGRFSCIR